MTTASLKRRVDRIAAARRPPKGLFYVAWGRVPGEIEASLEQAQRAGTIAEGDPVVRCAWPVGPALPPARWARAERYAFTHAEFGALMGEVDQFRDELIAEIRTELRARGVTVPEPAEDAPRPYGDPAQQLHDAELLAVLLAIPLGGERASLEGDRLERAVRYIGVTGIRASIRGSVWHLEQAVADAGRTKRH